MRAGEEQSAEMPVANQSSRQKCRLRTNEKATFPRAAQAVSGNESKESSGEFDPGSERTLAAGLTHASRARKGTSVPE